MLVRVLGKRELDFKSNDGKQIRGTQIFVAYKDTNPRSSSEGELAEKIFVPADSEVRIPLFEYGQEYDFQYESVGFGSHARSVLRRILTKDGKEPKYAARANDDFPF